MKKIIYTVITGNYCKLKEPIRITQGWEYICIANNDIESKNWKIINIYNIDNHKYDNQKLSRKYKIMNYLLNSDLSIYIDARFTPKCNLDKFIDINFHQDKDICLMRHNRRTCLYCEANYLINHNIGNKKEINKQVKKYRKEGMPEYFGLYAPGIMIRRRNTRVLKFMREWWEEVENGSYRDILSFPYVKWKNPDTKISAMEFKENYELFMDRRCYE